MVKKVQTLINCDCLEQKIFNKLTQSDKCVCRIGTSARTDKKIKARRVNVTIVERFGPLD